MRSVGQTVYADLLFLINFSMDFLCFYLCAKLLRRKLFMGRTVLAAAIGGVYAVVSLLWQVGRMAALLWDLGVCVIMCLLSFGGRRRMRSALVTVPVYLAVSMMLGGFMTAIFHLLNRIPALQEGQAEGEEGRSVWLFALLALLSALFTSMGSRFFRKRAEQVRSELSITYNGATVTLPAMTDSGNLLREPISGKPCILVDVTVLSSLLPSGVVEAVQQGRVPDVARIPSRMARSIRCVPMRTAAGEGMLVALRPEQLILRGEKGDSAVDAWIALSHLENGAEGVLALLPTQLLS